MESPLDILLFIARVFDEMNVRYVVVGSFASSMRGMTRATNDVDIVSDLRLDLAPLFISRVKEDFYVSEPGVQRAISEHRSFNLIHFDSSFKVDVFIPPPDGFGWQQLAHRQAEEIDPQGATRVYVATAEDTILAKFLWFRQGGEVSTQQWADILGVVKIRRDVLDEAYLREHAQRLGVLTLLERALAEAGFG
ncbi:MAG: hypothetical protein M3Q76_14125 [Acidobacteriota bacterium]|nr:hypothetical protein [Acidobacteriota bacterium]